MEVEGSHLEVRRGTCLKWPQGQGTAFYFLGEWEPNNIYNQRRKIQLGEGEGEIEVEEMTGLRVAVLGKIRHAHM